MVPAQPETISPGAGQTRLADEDGLRPSVPSARCSSSALPEHFGTHQQSRMFLVRPSGHPSQNVGEKLALRIGKLSSPNLLTSNQSALQGLAQSLANETALYRIRFHQIQNRA